MRINTGCWMNGCKCFDPDDEDGVGIKKDREWVGLTHTELENCILISEWATWIEVGRAIEAKLKDKNT